MLEGALNVERSTLLVVRVCFSRSTRLEFAEKAERVGHGIGREEGVDLRWTGENERFILRCEQLERARDSIDKGNRM